MSEPNAVTQATDFGPLEFLVMAFPGAHPSVEAVGALAGLRKGGDVRVVDSLVVAKGHDGAVTSAELADIEAIRDVAGGHDLATLIAADDADEVGETLEPGTNALILLVEHIWARGAASAVQAAGGRITGSYRIPAEHAEEALAAVERGGS